jgi:hypothetical protein
MHIAFNGDVQLKKDILEELVKYENGKVCNYKGYQALGRLTEVYGSFKNIEPYHTANEAGELLGIDNTLVKLYYNIFEGLSFENQNKSPVQFVSAINVSAKTNLVVSVFIIGLLQDIQQYVKDYLKEKNFLAISEFFDTVKLLHARKLLGENASKEQLEPYLSKILSSLGSLKEIYDNKILRDYWSYTHLDTARNSNRDMSFFTYETWLIKDAKTIYKWYIMQHAINTIIECIKAINDEQFDPYYMFLNAEKVCDNRQQMYTKMFDDLLKIMRNIK